MKGEVELITVDEFIKEVWEIEHIKIQITQNCSIRPGATERIRLAHYPYTEPFDGNKTVDEFLNERIRPCLPTTLLIASVNDDNGNSITIF